MLLNLLTSLTASGIVMKRNMDWHRQIIIISIPLFILFYIFQTEYVIYRLKKQL